MTSQSQVVKNALQNKRTEIVHFIRQQISQLNVGEAEPDIIDRMDGMKRREQTITLLDSLNRTLADVDAALLAVKGGSYGICAECDEPIAPRRLQVIPWASHCIRCQEALDAHGPFRTAAPYWGAAA